MPAYDLSSDYASVPQGFIDESRKTLANALMRIEHCVRQLDETNVWWRPHESMNAVGNLILHLCGNLGQWIVAGVGGEPFERDRPAEFAHREPIGKDELMRRLRARVDEVDRIFAAQDERSLLERRRIQGYDATVLTAMYHVVAHLEGHAQEVIYITRMRLGERYRFLWEPRTPEQAAGVAT
jgi:hypothetical protein